MLTSYLHFRLQRLRDRRRTVPVGPAQDGQRRVRSPPKPRPPVSAVSPPRVQVGPGPLERAQVRVDALPEGLDGRKYSIRFVLFVRFKVMRRLLLKSICKCSVVIGTLSFYACTAIYNVGTMS